MQFIFTLAALNLHFDAPASRVDFLMIDLLFDLSLNKASNGIALIKMWIKKKNTVKMFERISIYVKQCIHIMIKSKTQTEDLSSQNSLSNALQCTEETSSTC